VLPVALSRLLGKAAGHHAVQLLQPGCVQGVGGWLREVGGGGLSDVSVSMAAVF
jgi:hypothetical protein